MEHNLPGQQDISILSNKILVEMRDMLPHAALFRDGA